MRQFIKTSMLVLIFTLTVQQFYAQNNSETDLIGTWTIDYEKTLKNIHTQGQKTHETMGLTVRDRIEQAYKGRKLTFLEDGTFEIKLTNGRQANGIWSVSENKLFMTSSEGTDYDYQIHKITSYTLVLKTKEFGYSKPIFKYRHYTKN